MIINFLHKNKGSYKVLRFRYFYYLKDSLILTNESILEMALSNLNSFPINGFKKLKKFNLLKLKTMFIQFHLFEFLKLQRIKECLIIPRVKECMKRRVNPKSELNL